MADEASEPGAFLLGKGDDLLATRARAKENGDGGGDKADV